MSDENQAVILLNSLPELYREVKAVIKYGRDSLSMDIVLDALKTRNLEIKKECKIGELLMARDRRVLKKPDNPTNPVPELKRNLISLGELDRAGYSYKFGNKVLKVIKGSLVKLKGTLRNGLYVLKGIAVLGSPAVASGKETYKSIVKFGKGKHSTKGILDYAHSDLWGPTKVENQTGRKVKYLRIDNGLEFLNHKFDKFCKSEGIMRHFTVMYTPQQNGLAERCLSSALGLKAPQEIWTRKAPSLDYLRAFRCSAYAHVKEGKLNKRNQQTVDQVEAEVRIDYKARPSVSSGDSNDQSSSSDGRQPQLQRKLIDEGAFGEESSSSSDLKNYQLTHDRPQRMRQAPTRTIEGCYGSRVVLIAEQSDMMGVTTAFFHGELEEVIYMAQRKSYEGFLRSSYDACVY
ncbi:uncharacterized protein LOC120084019 [Benincasa hispida]|uniref:uncharacterized protein LOC120084019 n=1 Tax=Benincasa hispida TaxID=102211 RepID=UPI0019018F18|nr:uncharacterized protein LOC120084019 [Benincasa hispida]